MREIILDTETTGLDPASGHRIIEIGAIELINHLPSGRKFRKLINPECEVSPEAQAVHGIKTADLVGQPLFAEIVAELLEFIGDSRLIIHNAEFDLGFLNREFTALGFPALPSSRAIDTVQLARRKFPGAPASLDALCQRFGIDNSNRTLHGALLDAELLCDVYVELIGGKQAAMLLDGADGAPDEAIAARRKGPARPARPHAASAEENTAHAALLTKLKNPLWTAS